jgi:glucokinase
MRSIVAIDLGGTKLATAVVDETGTVRGARKVPVEKGDPRNTIAQILTEAQRAVEASGVPWTGINRAGAIVPGIFRSQDGTAWAPNLWGDRNVSLQRELNEGLPVGIHIDSDRAAYVAGEQWLGTARNLTDVVFVAVGTGIGAGIISGGKVIRGAGDIAGAVGWQALSPDYQDIYSHTGCWETEAAGPALARKGGKPSAEELIEAARGGDLQAVRVLDDVSRYLGMGIANLVSILNPQIVVLGGGVMQAGDLFLNHIRQEVLRWAHPQAAAQVRIELTTLGERAGLLGAAKLALDSQL